MKLRAKHTINQFVSHMISEEKVFFSLIYIGHLLISSRQESALEPWLGGISQWGRGLEPAK